MLFLANRVPSTRFAKDFSSRILRAEIGIAMIERMIRQSATHLVKVVVPQTKRIKKVSEAADVDVGGCAQTVNPGVECFFIANTQGPVRPERRIDAGFEP